MNVRIPSPLRSYTAGKSQVEAHGSTVAEALADLESKHNGIRFRMIDEQDRIREHIKIFVNHDLVEKIDTPLSEKDTLHIICALSGG